MEDIRQALLSVDSDDFDEALIQKVEALASSAGNQVYQVYFALFADVDLQKEEAKESWSNLLTYRDEISDSLSRKMPLIAILSDFLVSQQILVMPKIVELSDYEKTEKQSTHDSLTGIFNRQYFKYVLEQQLALSKRYGTDLSLLFLDVDNFKDINDRYGHIAGDNALQMIAKILTDSVRECDVVARYGGEEFVALMPQTTSLDALILADRIRQKVQDATFEADGSNSSLTISGGVASYPVNAKSVEELIYLADSALYRAKGAGKNNIALFKEDKRRFLRIGFKQPVMVKELAFDENIVQSGMSKDICVGGILFESPKSLQIGTKIQISVPIVENDPLLLIGNVVRVELIAENKYDIGVVIAFKEMDKAASNEISRFLLEHIKRS